MKKYLILSIIVSFISIVTYRNIFYLPLETECKRLKSSYEYEQNYNKELVERHISELSSTQDESYNNGFNDGYVIAASTDHEYKEGYKAGFEYGYSKGHEDGEEVGYYDGYDAAQSDQ